jgi:Zn finger protein HypA/HybF involved in hydrogenase expression
MVAELVNAAAVSAAGRTVALVRVRYASTIPEDVLRQAFAMLTAEGPIAGAALDAVPFEIRLGCPCGYDGALGHDDVIGPGQGICPSCGSLQAFPRTPELELVEVRIAT